MDILVLSVSPLIRNNISDGIRIKRVVTYKKGQPTKSDIPPNIAPKIFTSENYLQISDSSATLIGQLAIVTLFGAILGGIPLSGAYPIKTVQRKVTRLMPLPLPALLVLLSKQDSS